MTLGQKSACGKAILGLRSKTPYSQQEFADICGFEVKFLKMLETGKSEPCTMTLIKIARTLGMKPGALLDAICEEMERQGVLHPFT